MARRRTSLASILLPYARSASIALGIVALALVLAIGAAMLLVDPNSFTPRIVAAVQRATGRQLAIRGPMSLAFGLPPTLVAEDIGLSNLAGGSRADMVKLQRLDLHVALLPLLAGEIDVAELVLTHPDVLLETNAAGQGNWRFTPAPADAAARPAATQADAGVANPPAVDGWRFSVRSVQIRDMHVAWRDPSRATTTEWSIPRFAVEAEQAGRSMLVNGSLISGGRTMAVSGETGPLGRLLDPAATIPWPLELVAQTDGLRLALRGTLLHPLHGLGYSLQIDGAATDLTPIAAFLPQPPLRLHDGSISAQISDPDGQGAALSALSLHAIGLQVPWLLSGVDFLHADVSAPAPDKSVHADLQVATNAASVRLRAMLGSLAAILPNAVPQRALPVELTVDAAGAILTLKGSVRTPATMSGLDLTLFARVPNLAELDPLAGRSLPDMKQIALDATIDGGLASGATLGVHKLTLTLPESDLSGDFSLALGPRPALRGSVSARQLDLDSLLAALAASVHAAPATASAAGTQPRVAPPPPAALKPAKPNLLIPDTPIDFGALDRADGDVQIAIAALQTNGVNYSNIAGHLVLQNGRLALDPFTGTTPGGRLDARFILDSRPPQPPVDVILHAPAISLQPFAAAFGDPDAISGSGSVDADLHGAGRSAHAIAASLDGRLAVTLSDGDLDNALLTRLLGNVLQVAKLPENLIGDVGRTRLHCFATRLDIGHGVATVPTLVADTTRLLVQGSGSLDLGQETLALHLRPMVRTGPGIVIPVQIGGTFLAPKTNLDAALGGGKGGLLGALAGALPAERPGDACAAALAVARAMDTVPAAPAQAGPAQAAPTQAAPAAPAPAATFPPPAPAKRPKPIDVLRGLLH
jgi:uncharacterized protein involved in outer membrane biogenesis